MDVYFPLVSSELDPIEKLLKGFNVDEAKQFCSVENHLSTTYSSITYKTFEIILNLAAANASSRNVAVSIMLGNLGFKFPVASVSNLCKRYNRYLVTSKK